MVKRENHTVRSESVELLIERIFLCLSAYDRGESPYPVEAIIQSILYEIQRLKEFGMIFQDMRYCRPDISSVDEVREFVPLEIEQIRNAVEWAK